MFKALRPKIDLLGQEAIDAIVSEAIGILVHDGFFIENQEGQSLLLEAGMRVDADNGRAWLTEDLIQACLQKMPRVVRLYDRHGKLTMNLKDDQVHFDPGSAAINIVDRQTGKIRPPCTKDYIEFTTLVDALPYYSAQSTSLVCADVPEPMSDWYRLYIALTHCTKPVITGTFNQDSFSTMYEMLLIIRNGDARALRRKPLAIFDACPSPPLKWSDLTCQSLIDCARAGIPSELVSMPMCGATAPITLSGALVQHTAENLSGIVISQLAAPRAPIIYGGSPSVLDMRQATTPMGAIETMMLDMAYSAIGKHLGLPVHAYMGLSDAKITDYQAGCESASGALLAALAGINVISGPGMLDFESTQSFQKLILDHEVCGMALRLIRGIQQRHKIMAASILRDFQQKEHLLSHPSTLRWFQKELFLPGPVFDRQDRVQWEMNGCQDAWYRAGQEVERILNCHTPEALPQEMQRALKQLARRNARRYGYKITI